MALPCFKCNRELEDVFDDDAITNQPYAGTTFDTHGHYGSTIFDPMMDPEYLEINICDECLREHHDRVLLRLDSAPKQESNYSPWQPPARP